jgi:Flp pilus assembly protein TadG
MSSAKAGGSPFDRLLRNEAGNVGMILAIVLPVLVMMVGGAIDMHRASAARSSSQDAADMAVLAAAASRDQDLETLTATARKYFTENLDGRNIHDGFTSTIDEPAHAHLRLRATVKVPTLFMGIIGINEIPVNVSATATRGAAEKVELALVLDNTWSMSERDAGGTSKIDALKSASRMLVDELMSGPAGQVKIGVVPYADYVNVGVTNRSRPWVSVPADYTTTTPRTCKTVSTKQECTRGAPKTCTRSVDGVSETYDCTPSVCTTVPVTPYESCSGGGTQRWRWFGCVGSRKEGVMRLNDNHPEKPYPGFLSTSQNCLNPITPLTDQRATVRSAVQGLIVNVGGYRPLTYIPSGLIWGVNMLSPVEPLTDAGPYDSANRNPRKILVLMTDGENTLRFDPSTGKHLAFSTNGSSGAAQYRASNDDTVAICEYAKSRNIELFTVALAVDSGDARGILQDCASSPDHYFDARDTAALRSSFSAIAASINRVRLVE